MAYYRDRKRQIFGPKEFAMRSLRCFATCLLIAFIRHVDYVARIFRLFTREMGSSKVESLQAAGGRFGQSDLRLADGSALPPAHT
jgi:hypothetical protein